MSVSKPCVICEKPIVRRAPSELKRVRVHMQCRGAWLTLHLAENRHDKLMERWAGLRPAERVRLAKAYRLGALHTLERLRAKRRARAEAAKIA